MENKKVTNNNKISTPTSIFSFGYVYNDPKIIANIMNNFFIQKIKKKHISKEFSNNILDPLIFFKKSKSKGEYKC